MPQGVRSHCVAGIASLAFLLACALPGAGAADWSPRQWDDFPVRIELQEKAQLERVLSLLTPEQVRRESLRPRGDGWILDLRVDEARWSALQEAGWAVERRPDLEREGRTAVERAWSSRQSSARKTAFTFPLSAYPTHAEIGGILSDLAAARPDITRLTPMGTSYGGRTIWGLVISDHPDSAEAEPEVRLAAGIHGDEPVDGMMLLDLAWDLVTHHGQPGHGFETSLVDETEIHLFPLFNPDGYAAGTRANARGVDLNRNFPEPAGAHAIREEETAQFMAHALDHHFVISQMGHGGALVVNYPWDYTYTRAPDDDALIQLSLEYSTQNLPMYDGAFSQGITNGADWYVVTGSLQDWSYDQTGCIDLTIEVSNTKWPFGSSLPGYWSDNRQSLLDFVEAARFGIRGVVTDSRTGDPLDAVITLAGNAKPVSTDPSAGDFYKLVDGGSYDLTVEAIGYEPRTLTEVSTTWGTSTVVDVALDPIGVATPEVAPMSRLIGVAPNPFNPATEISFVNARAGRVRLTVLDVRGRHRRTLLDEELAAGPARIRWDGRDDAGRAVASGVYFVRLHALDATRTAKAVLVQ